MSDSEDPSSGLMSGLRRRLSNSRDLEDRLSQLEAEVDELKQLNLRLAELTDVVQELLLPLARQDPEGAVELLERYRDELGT